MRQEINPLLQPTITDNLPPPPLKVAPKFKIKNVLIVVIIGILLCSTSALAYYTFIQKPQTPPIVTVSPTPIPPTAIPTAVTTPVEEIVWLDKPQKTTLSGVFTESDDSGMYHFDQTEYFITATLPDGSKLINAFVPTEGMGLYIDLYRFIKSESGKISYIDEDNQWENTKKLFNSQISLSSFNIRQLTPPETISFDKDNIRINFKKGYIKEGTFDKVKSPKFIGNTEYGDLYAAYFPYTGTYEKLTGVFGREIYLKLKDSTFYTYEYQPPFINDNKTSSLNWLDGKPVTSTYNYKIISGCGTGVFSRDIIKNNSPLLNSKEVVATDNQINIYQVKDPSNLLLKTLYESYNGPSQDVNRDLNFEEFIKVKNHFLYQDFLGDWLIFVNQDYGSMAECGKPVIYLYPQKDTQVTVKVGADITLSEPIYPQGGWTVLAHPNGQLEYHGQIHPNLFWEGLGWGPYPDISNRGFVVSQMELVPTLRNHLLLLGLNQQESADFLDFWLPKMPTTPYIRLTWLDTSEMNQLAPLSVLPRPDTVIRIFLDFAGLDKSVSLTPQKLTAPPRRGFTLVEWGGLLLK